MNFPSFEYTVLRGSPIMSTLVIRTRGAWFSIMIDGERNAEKLLDELNTLSLVICESLGYHKEAVKQAHMEMAERMAKELNKRIVEAEIEASHQPPEGSPSEPHEEERE